MKCHFFIEKYVLKQNPTYRYRLICYNILEVMNMNEVYNKSLKMIKILRIKNKRENNKLLEYYLILSIDSLKVMSKTKNFKEIIKMANKKY